MKLKFNSNNGRKSNSLVKFERLAALLLEFEGDFLEVSKGDQTTISVDLQKEEFKVLWEKVRVSYETFATNNTIVDSEEDCEAAKYLYKECRLAYITIAAQICELSQSFINKPVLSSTQCNVGSNSASNTVVNRPTSHILNLPPCKIEVFKGDYKSWPTFRDMFTAIYINCEELTDVQRLCYLRQFTSLEAQDIVSDSDWTNEGFNVAWENLVDTYENKRILVNNQLKQLYSLTPVKTECAKDIKRLQREIKNCISVLTLNGVDISGWDAIFVFFCSINLPVLSLSLWEQSVKNKKEIPKWSDLDGFLKARFQSLETVFDLRHFENTDIGRFNSGSSSNKTLNKFENRAGIKTGSSNNSTGTKVKSYQAKATRRSCPLCSKDHLIRFCSKFVNMNPEERFLAVKRHNLCINCLIEGHKLQTCKSNFSCSVCKLKHNSMLHREVSESSPTANSSSSQNSGQTAQPSTSVQNCFAATSKHILLGTAMVNIICRGDIFTARAIIDPGSQSSFISEKLQRKLNLPTRSTNIEISSLNNADPGRAVKECEFTLGSVVNNGFKLEMSALILPKLTGKLPNKSVDISNLRSSLNIPLADPNFGTSRPIDILIGSDFYPKIMIDGSRQKIFGNLMGHETYFGWVLIGSLADKSETSSNICSFYTKISLDKQLEKFWELEEPPQVSRLTPEDKYCEEFYKKTTIRNSDGRYEVSLPFKPQFMVDKQLGPSREKASRQFLRNEISLLKNPELKSVYDNVLSEYEELGHMIQVDETDVSTSYYLPHHAVFKPESSSTKVRVVFNASSRTSSGLSLNDMLYTGPILQNDLMLLIIRWRFYRYVFNGDIVKMYRQILLDPKQTAFQRIVFRNNPNSDLKDFELKTVTFGLNCAPFLAIRTLLQLADDVEEKLPWASKILRRMMYVDDALVGTHEISLAITARDQLILALSSAGFSMRKWTSNDERILQGLPRDHLLREDFLKIDDESTAKTLGVRWNAKVDQFYFVTAPITLKEKFTKREVLSIIAQLFDPAGWLGPVVIIAKILMQQVWSDKTDWDEYLSEASGLKWNQFLRDYGSIDNIRICRWVGFKPSTKLQVHGFSDASEKAYGACVYVRLEDEDGSVQTHLLLAKSKVAPLKTISLPRLELCGASLLADLLDTVRKDLNFDENRTKVFTWSDSMIVLAWLQKPPSSWTTFVANRVSKIVEKIGKDCWRHVSSSDNPADLLSRGVRPQDLVENNLWWHGPSWLCSDSVLWEAYLDKDFGTNEEQRVQKVFFLYFKSYCDLIENFSSYPRAIRVMAYVMRGINAIFKIKGPRYTSIEITSEEMNSVKERLMIIAQKALFSNEYYKLSRKEPILGSKLLNLNPFIDEKGIIRVGGRLANTPNLSYNEKFPILLPSDCHLTILLVNFIHKITLHGGNQLMLRVLRTEYFIPRAKNLIKSVIGRCKICTIQKKAIQNQIMAALPMSRTIISRPFNITGVDFAGPFDIRNYTGRACLITKGYVCVFVCFATKAIHLEAVSSLSTPAFLAAFSRFVSRRGYPKDVYSDNGTNFVGASRELKTEFRSFLRDIGSEVNVGYAPQGLHWHFNPASAPHMGGLWEAGVKSFKYHFRRIAGGLKYTFEEFSTLLARIESCLNSRPLCPLSESADCLDVLTPGHFLIGGPLLAPPELEISEAPVSIINRWQRVKAINQRLCMRWKDEYLKDLQKRHKWKFMQRNIEIGDMVVIREDNLPTNEWRLGRVQKVHIGKDGHVRVVELKTARGLVTRPVVKLVVLPTY
ncbi:uncharacterized protein LOC135950281 [Calliphora vicina]|uniref:uncharacterized protein LOC135950281 n=1 Tax=Calliphora vicina TaxID=7373 RepID=UPI00325A7EF8